MLVLTRKRSEVIQIGENIVIKIIQTGKSSVKIGIEAPGNVRVLRGELEPHTGNEYLLERLKNRHSVMGNLATKAKGTEEVMTQLVSESAVEEAHLVTADFS